MDLGEFRKEILKVNKKKVKFNVTNSHGTKDAWRWIKKNKWLNIGQPVTEAEFGKIVKAINNTLQDQLLNGKDVSFPERMGRLEIRKFNAKVALKNDKIVTSLPIDWKRTQELWWKDEEAHKAKTLVRFEGRERFTIYYNKGRANYINKGFYKFIPTRTLKKRLKDKINNGGYDVLLLAKNNEIY